MKKPEVLLYSELSAEEQKKEEEKEANAILKDIIEMGWKPFDDETNKKIDEAGRKADQMQTPWFVHEYIMEAVGDKIWELARELAREKFYSKTFIEMV